MKHGYYDNNHILTTLLYHLINVKTTDFKQKNCIQENLFNLYTALYYMILLKISIITKLDNFLD